MRGILDPVIELYRPVPPLAYLPLMVIWFGIGETSKILLIYLAIFAPVAMSVLAGVKSAQQVRIRAAQSLGASRAQVLWFVILPGALPEILTGLRIGLGVGWSTLVAAELIAATRGLGFMVQSPLFCEHLRLRWNSIQLGNTRKQRTVICHHRGKLR